MRDTQYTDIFEKPPLSIVLGTAHHIGGQLGGEAALQIEIFLRVISFRIELENLVGGMTEICT